MNRTLTLRQALNPERPIALSKIRLICTEGDRASLHIKSTLDNTYKLDHKTDEDLSFTDDDLIAIKNQRESPCKITLKVIELHGGRRAILSPSRGVAVALLDPSVSQLRSECVLTLGGGETCMLRTSLWQPKVGVGSVFPV